MKRNKKSIISLIGMILVAAVAVGGIAMWLRENRLEQLQNEALAELERNAGQYDEQSIVLYETSRTRAEELAKLFGAELRITENGCFATLTLPEGTTIRDVYALEESREYIQEMAADYQVRVSDLGEEENGERLPQRPQYTVSDSDYELQTYLDYLNMGKVWGSYTGNGVTVAVIDTGIDTDHPEFAGRISEYSYNATEDQVVMSADGSCDWSLIEDEVGHGTAVAGVLAADMDNGNVVGIAPNVNILVIKAECDAQGNFKRISDLIYGLYYAIERDVQIVNMSFGLQGATNPFEEALQLAYDSDVICVAAAGNDATSALYWPAADARVIGVGALDGWALAQYSNYGENVQVCAPGSVYTTCLDGQYGTMQGTSFACSVVAGAIALYMQAHRYATFDQVTEILYASCQDLGSPGRDWNYGFGVPDLSALTLEWPMSVTYDMLTDELDNQKGLFIQGYPLQEFPEPERLYYIFDGWYYDDTCTQEVDYYTDAFYSDTTLYAKWIQEDEGLPYTYRILDDGTVEITGYTGHRRFITVPEKVDGRVVTSIGDNAFANQSRLREISLPTGLTNIGAYAFSQCANLVSIEIPQGVKSIGDYAFYDCARLHTVAMRGNSKLETIGQFAFRNCSRLEKVELPAALVCVDGSAFYGATSLVSITVQTGNGAFVSQDGVLFNAAADTLLAYPADHGSEYTLPQGTLHIAEYAFAFARLTQIDLTNVRTLGEGAFACAQLQTLTIPDSITDMGSDAFSSNRNLYQVTFGRGLTTIPSGAFAGCTMLRQITIPNCITEIGGNAFNGSVDLENVTFEANSQLARIGGSAFFNCKLKQITIPQGVTDIGDYAFSGVLMGNPLTDVAFAEDSVLQRIGANAFEKCLYLNEIHLPASLREIGPMAFARTGLNTVTLPAAVTYLGDGAFAYNTALRSVAVEAGNTVYQDVDGVVYTLDGSRIHTYPAGATAWEYFVLDGTKTIHSYAFAGVDNLYTAYLPNSLEEVASFAFESAEISTISIPDQVVQIGQFAFQNCWRLETIVFGEQSRLPRISYGAFAYCGIRSFTVPANVSTIGQGAFLGCKKLFSVTFASGSKVDTIPAYMFEGCTALQTVSFGWDSQLTNIEAHGFEGMVKLKTVNFGNAKLTNIDNFAFRFCSSLSTLELPETVRNIGRYAFFGCRSLVELLVPQSIEHIGSYAFLGCEELDLYLAAEQLPDFLDENWDFGIRGYYVGVASVEENGDYKYAVLTSGNIAILKYLGNAPVVDLTVLDFGGAITQIGGSAFQDSAVTAITLPETLTAIQAEAFQYSALEHITIPAAVTFIGREAFAYTDVQSVSFAAGSQLAVMEQYAFAGTKKLSAVTLPASLTTMGTGVFLSSGLETVIFENGIQITEIPQKAFAETKLTGIALPDSVALVNHNAFHNVQTLRSIAFGNHEGIRLMSNAFYHTGLTDLHIPANVTYIGEYCFVGLFDLAEFTVDVNNPNYMAQDGMLMSKDGRRLIAVPGAKTGSIMVPLSVEIIGAGAFEESSASQILFHSDTNILTIGYRAFFEAKKITAITIPASVVSIDYYAFAYCENLETVTFAAGNQLTGIYEGAFVGCPKLENIVLPDSVKEISDFAFYGCGKLQRLPLTETTGVLGIFDYAFAHTGIADEITMPSTLVDIGRYAFQGTKITRLTVPADNQKQLRIDFGAFADCNYLEEITLPFVGALFEDDTTGFTYVFGLTGVPESLKTVTIAEGIRVLYSGAFTALSGVETLHLPHSICQVYGDALYDCRATYELTNIITIDASTTFFWSGIAGKITLSDRVTMIPNRAFGSCKNLESVVLPESVREIGWEAFRDCSALTSIQIPSGVSVIAGSTFEGCGSLREIELPEALLEIQDKAFSDCVSLTSIVIPAGVREIGSYAFSDCHYLADVTISEGVELIGWCAFSSCYCLTEITIPASVHTIWENAFVGCNALVNVHNLSDLELRPGSADHGYVALYAHTVTDPYGNRFYLEYGSETQWLETEDQFLFAIVEDGYKLRSYLGSDKTIALPETVMGQPYELESFRGGYNIILPQSMTQLPDYAFYGNTSMHSVTLPDGLQSIGYAAFKDCKALQSITLPQGLISVGNAAFADCWNLQSVVLPEGITTIGKSAFLNCASLRRVQFPDSLTHIGDSAFRDCYLLEAIRLPDNLESIGAAAFKGCYGVLNLTLPKTLQSVGDEAFEGCDGLLLVTVCGDTTDFGTGVFAACRDDLVFAAEGSAICLVDGLVYNRDQTQLLYVPKTVSGDLVLPDTLEKISPYAFRECNQLRSIVIPGSVTEIGTEAFAYCSALAQVEIAEGLRKIGDNAFDYCVALESISIPDSVTYIGRYAFGNCANLKYVALGSGVDTMAGYYGGYDPFGYCPNLEWIQVDEHNARYFSQDGIVYDRLNHEIAAVPEGIRGEITLPQGIVSVMEADFRGCAHITGITLPSSVGYIADQAFSWCDSLEYIHLEDGNTSFFAQDGVIYAADPLKIVHIPQKLSGHIVLAEGLRSLDYNFRNCGEITGITIPASVDQMELRYYDMFSGCRNLQTILVAEGNTQFFAKDNILYSASPVEIVSLPGVLPNNLVLAEGLTTIRTRQFSGRQELVSITLLTTLQAIEWDAFSGCIHLFEVVNNSQLPITGPWNSDYGYIGWYAKVIVTGPGQVSSGLVQVKETEDGFRYIKYGNDYWLIAYIGDKATITLPENLEGYDYTISCFRGGKHIIIPDTVTAIGYEAFRGNMSMESLVIGTGVTEIGSNAFNDCKNLKQVVIPGNVEVIGAAAFQNCTGLERVEIREGVRIIDDIAFDNCNNLMDISIPSSMEYIGQCAISTVRLADNEKLWNNGVLAVDGWILRVRDDVEYIPNIMSYRGAAGGAYSGCNRLKTIVWDGYGCESAETVIVKHMTYTDWTNQQGPLKMTLSLKNVVIPADIDLLEFYENYRVFFAAVSGIRIYVENSEEMARYDDNFPGWNNNNKVIYGGRWTWANFYDREGVLISSMPRPNAEVIRRPVVADYTDGEYRYIFEGWDTDGDGLVNNLPATMIVDLHAYPVYTVLYDCQTLGHVFGQWVTITEPTEEQAGLKERTCLYCGHTEQEQIAPITTAIRGDVNGDGKINARDARALLRYIAGLVGDDEISIAAADYNGDGKINARDARAILRYIAGLD